MPEHCRDCLASRYARRLAVAALCIHASGLYAQTVSNAASLSFGSFAAGSGGSVSVSVSGVRSKTGGVLLVGQGGLASAAQFVVTGTPNASYSLTLPVDAVLSDGSRTMTLGNFVSSPGPTGILSGGGTQLVRVGARLTVGNLQVPGNYVGAFSLTVNYE